ncbi:hypothetical protein IV38_GL000398 [Lactobacillus selangorensis]|uniref:Uncharacterized protein n=1 Tax=Lactobacillus selangorensis TaxID=81857 RepID=A0A0R2G6W6_9LACO|nr:hypothetical protein [Lactobacillus selangorensis]KRN29513.1 hypothetical protein IV38_GL000398 [Lactobacillus selangorensis]KRN33957.1 hypothetical protein IV40_GL000270 [Lactobacillus selangorensis]
MIIQFKEPVNTEVVRELQDKIHQLGKTGFMSQNHMAIIDLETLEFSDDEKEAIASVTTDEPPYVLSSKTFKPDNTVIQLHETSLGDTQLPLFVHLPQEKDQDSLSQRFADLPQNEQVTGCVADLFAQPLSPYEQVDRQDIEQLLTNYRQLADQQSLDLIVPVYTDAQFDAVAKTVDMVELTGDLLNDTSFLQKVGQTPIPVLIDGTKVSDPSQLLMMAEFIASAGNIHIAVLSPNNDRAVATLRLLTHYPVLAQPAAKDYPQLLPTLAASAAVAGAQGMILPVGDTSTYQQVIDKINAATTNEA